MQNKWNRAVSVRGNETMNFLALVPYTELRPLRETRKRHVLNVLCPYSLQDVWQYEILLNHHVISA